MRKWILPLLIVYFLAEVSSQVFKQNFWLCFAAVLVVGYFAVNILGGALEGLKGDAASSGESVHRWPSLGRFEFEVVGESNYQNAIHSIAETNASAQCLAMIVPEDDNKFDQLAVRIDIQNKTVGYMSRDDARSFRKLLSKKKISGKVTSCDAAIIGGFVLRDGSKASYGVTLDIKPFD
jgi:hypothetical protein